LAKPRLFKTYTLCLPTIWGWLLLAILLSSLAVWSFRNIGFFLAHQKPVPSKILVVDGWMTPNSLLLAARYFERNNYQFVITSGGPIKHTILNPQHDYYAEQASFILERYGIPAAKIITIPTPASAQNRTFLSAVTVRDWLDKNMPSYQSLNLFTGGVHSRRSLLLYKMAFDDDKQLGVIVAPPDGYQLSDWWTSSAGVKSVLMETFSFAWTVCCFSPGDKGSHQEKWGIH
jgi:hypothetical protein